MHRQTVFFSLLLGALCWIEAGTAIAQQPQAMPEPTATTTTSEKAERKTPGWIFRRPAKDTPADQLVHARDLEARKKTGKAMRAYRALVHEWHDSNEAVIAQEAYARLLLAERKYERAFDEFQYLVDYFPGRFPFAPVLDHQFSIANHLMTQRGRFLFFFSYASPERALPLFEKVVANGPGGEHAPQAQFYIGLIQEDDKQYDLAVAAYETLLFRYPAGPFAEEASRRRAESLYYVAKEHRHDEMSCRNALSALASCLRDYPDNAHADSLGAKRDELSEKLADMYYERALYYDKAARHPVAALIKYRDFIKKFPWSKRAEAVNQRIDELQKEQEARD